MTITTGNPESDVAWLSALVATPVVVAIVFVLVYLHAKLRGGRSLNDCLKEMGSHKREL